MMGGVEVEVLDCAVGGVKASLQPGAVHDAKTAFALVKEQLEEHGLLQLDNLHGTPGEIAAFMEELMEGFGPRDGMPRWDGTPADPEEDGEDLATKPVVPNHPIVRVLGNTVDDKTGRATALLAKTGYQWHQDTRYGRKGFASRGRCFTMLYCRESPPSGAETLFCRCAKLWSNLSPDEQAFVETHDAIYSNASTAGGPTAFDAAYGLRMNATGTRRIRASGRRRASWQLNENRRKLCGRDPRSGEMLFWGMAANFERFEGMEAEESTAKLDELMLSALGTPEVVGDLDDNLDTVSETVFAKDVVMKAAWKPGMAVIWDNARWLHSTTPVAIYAEGRRVMYQIIHHAVEASAP